MQMVDLRGQYERLRAEIDTAIEGVLESAQFVKGSTVTQFEEDLARFLDVPHVVSCGNGTDALQLALMALDLSPGDEVITPNFTFFATAEVVALLGFKPVLVDVTPDDFTIDCNKLQAAITPRTRAIIPVHLFGQCADMERILTIARQHDLYVIEDNAQALGSDCHVGDAIRKAGTIGTIGTTSFFPSKNLGCYGDGGAIFCSDEQLAQRLRVLANHGMFERYRHELIGLNSRLDTMQAAILLVKLRHLDDFNRRRVLAADRYDAFLANLTSARLPVRNVWSRHIFHQYTLCFESNSLRDLAKQRLAENGIPSMIYYPLPLHRQTALRNVLGDDIGDFPVSDMLSQTLLSLPMHTELTEGQQRCVAKVLLEL